MNKPINKNLTILNKIEKLEEIASIKKQLELISQIIQEGTIGEEALLNLLINRRIIRKTTLMILDGCLFEALILINHKIIKEKLSQFFPNGIIELKSSLSLNYQPLQKLLIEKQFQEADQLTQIYLCKLAGLEQNCIRNWLYFTDIALLPSEDLYIIDLLWRIYSQGKFGFSIQRKIWLANDCNWEILWNKIGWKKQGNACRYPGDFIWNINGPPGHLPLFNQLRGMQVLSALFAHIVWN
uniref:GUN4-like domain-containing protein n=1 Tax=Inkyuleea mariana TaxID=123988 RepID=A0A4D6X201_9FLOR|nr:hypothetical protein [Inkyuleea mariana]